MLAPLFTRYAASERVEGALGVVVDLLSEGALDRASFDAVVAEHGVAASPAFRVGLLDLVLYAAREALRDHCLTGDEAFALRTLTVTFRVVEGEFTARRRAELAVLLEAEMARVADDGLVDWTEAAYLDALQAAFKLGYDDFLDVACGRLTPEQRRALRLP